ncbi:hypothetical protein SAMN05444166_4868 [Singulisphaera sp. GP187]|uniref:DUF6263 family protein n=1 Tax=Singulisphaera sp. GP187 TaxID=1882752 RepID=UPI00092C0678|nr:DUF6263 family protein [Singulisphaera sp. GP187]SIO45478.1 hypothetical protein SAMN05444166_4868 [Singulisphaera sp. GP187]
MRVIPLATWRGNMVGWLLLVVAGFSGASAHAATLHWKFQPGETIHYAMDQKTITSVKGGPQDIKSTMSQTIDMDWGVKEIGADGLTRLTQTVTRVRTKIEAAFGTFEFDSQASKDPEGPVAAGLVPLLRALVGAEFSFKMNAQGEMSDVKVPEKVLETIKKSGALGGNSGMFSEDGLKNMVIESGLAVPKEELGKGKSWARESKLSMQPIGTMTLDKTYIYQGPETKDAKDLERIDLVTKVDIQLTPGNNIDMKVQSQDGKGSFFFDNAAGRVAESTVSEKIEMVFKLKVGDQETQIIQGNETTTTMKLVNAQAADSSKK